MIQQIKQLFCRHRNNQVICWHYTHGSNGNEITHIETQLQCHRCGKYWITLVRDPEDFDFFEENYIDRYWSDTCKPI